MIDIYALEITDAFKAISIGQSIGISRHFVVTVQVKNDDVILFTNRL